MTRIVKILLAITILGILKLNLTDILWLLFEHCGLNKLHIQIFTYKHIKYNYPSESD